MLRPGEVGWWPGVSIADPPSALSVGESFTLAVRSPLGYRLRAHLTLTELDPGRSMAATSGGDLRGAGRLELAAAPGGSILTFRWNVSTERTWMNATTFALRPVFASAHAQVMRAGERGFRDAVRNGV